MGNGGLDLEARSVDLLELSEISERAVHLDLEGVDFKDCRTGIEEKDMRVGKEAKEEFRRSEER
jgi:hypothetical protein